MSGEEGARKEEAGKEEAGAGDGEEERAEGEGKAEEEGAAGEKEGGEANEVVAGEAGGEGSSDAAAAATDSEAATAVEAADGEGAEEGGPVTAAAEAAVSGPAIAAEEEEELPPGPEAPLPVSWLPVGGVVTIDVLTLPPSGSSAKVRDGAGPAITLAQPRRGGGIKVVSQVGAALPLLHVCRTEH